MEDKLTREIVNLDPISRGSLVNYIEKLTVEVENEIKKVLPSKFGVMLDGWTDNGTSMHYIGVFACFPDKKTKFPLLAFSPLPDEERFDADVHKLFLEQTMSIFSTSLSSIAFLVQNNAGFNKAIADKNCVTLLGCDSHRLNLAVRKYIKDLGYTEDISKVNAWSIGKRRPFEKIN